MNAGGGAVTAPRLRAFLAEIESGLSPLPTRALVAAIGAEAHGALRAAGALRPASPLAIVPCDAAPRPCWRAVAASGSPRMGVCKDPKGTCAPRAVDPAELAQDEVSAPDVARLLRELYAADGRGLPPPGSFRAPEIVVLGWQPHEAGEREVALVTRPGQQLYMAVAVMRRRLVLVPTARHVTAEHRKKHGPGAFIAIEVLEEALDVRAGRIARGDVVHGANDAPPVAAPPPEPPRPAPPPPEPTPPPAPRAAIPAPPAKPPPGAPAAGPLIPGARRWADVSIYLVDGEMVRIDVPGRCRRFSYVDLGMAKVQNRRPNAQWQMLRAICEGDGEFKWRDFGQFQAARKTVSRLRQKLRTLFGLDEQPIRTFSFHQGFRVSFRAFHEPPAERQPPMATVPLIDGDGPYGYGGGGDDD